MKFPVICLGVLALLSTSMISAQSTDRTKAITPVKQSGNVNPINPFQLSADPTAVEYEGRLYVYGSNDQQEYDENEGQGNNTYGKIKTLVMMSTADMVNWTFHGTIDMKEACGSWMGNSWAPSIVSRVEDDGLTHFYMYFSNGGGGVGVVTATSPVGPWKAPMSRVLVNHSTPGLGPCSWPFDPGVVIDDNGVAWLTLGGGDPVSGGNALLPGNAKIVRLGADMVSFDSDFINIPAPFQFEASELNYINGKYVYTYCSSWSSRDLWSEYPSSQAAPSTCSMCYMVSDNPLDPNSWTYGGEILKNPGAFGYPWGNNHTHMHKFKDKYYMIYHTQVMENLAGIGGAYRSIGIDVANVDEENVVISPIQMTNVGPSIIDGMRINPFEVQQAETMHNGAGFSISNSNTPGNTYLTNLEHGAWTQIKKVDFGDKGANRLTVKISGSGQLEIRLSRVGAAPVAVFDYNSSRLKEVTFELPREITGERDVFLVFTNPSAGTRFDYWKFDYDETQGISNVSVDKSVVAEQYFTLDGMSTDSARKGFVIKKVTYADGSVSTYKVWSSK